MTAEELAAAKVKLAALEAALDSLLMGEKLAEAKYQEFSEKYHPADIARLESRIERLRFQITRAEGGRVGAVHVGF